MKLRDIARISPEAARTLEGVTVHEGDVLINITGDSIARCALVDPAVLPAHVSQHVAIIRSGPQLDGRYLQRYLVQPSIKEFLLSIAAGGTRKALTKAQLGDIAVAVPPLEVQRAIAEVLGALDDKIAANARSEAGSDAFIGALYSWAIKDDAHNAPIMEALQVQFGEPFAGQFFCAPGEGRPLIRIRDLKSFRAQVWTTERRARETVVTPGDVVVGMDAEFTPTAWLGPEGLMNQRVCKVASTLAGPAFVRESLRQPLSEIEGYKSATTVIHLNKADLERHAILVPRDDRLRSFEERAEPVYEQRIAVAQERAALAATRDALLPALMSGALRVKDAERLAEDLT